MKEKTQKDAGQKVISLQILFLTVCAWHFGGHNQLCIPFSIVFPKTEVPLFEVSQHEGHHAGISHVGHRMKILLIILHNPACACKP